MLQWRTRHAALAVLVALASVIAALGGIVGGVDLDQFNW
jgi:hypothetical protein